MTIKAHLTLCSALAALAIAGAARAQPAQPAAPPDAERLFREGRALIDAGDFAHACPKFAESEKLDPAPGTLLSLADCEERNKSLVKAREHYQLAASGFPKKDPRRAFATGRAAAIDKKIAHVTLRLSASAPPETSVRLGDVVVARTDLGTSTAIDPGDVQVKVSAPARKDNVVTVTFAEGESKDVVCDVGAPDAPPPVDLVTTPRRNDSSDDRDRVTNTKSDPRRTAAYVLLGVGVASLVVGGVSGILAVGKASTVKDHCNDQNACDQEGVDAASSGKFLSPLSTVTLIAGAALAAAGAYFYVVSSKTHKTPPTALLQALQLRGSF